MAHTSETRWIKVAEAAALAAQTMVDALLAVESKYQDLLELYAYCGNSAQGLADQLFKEDWEARSTPGQQAALTYDAAAGAITAVLITQGGTGYTDGTGYIFAVPGGGNDGLISYDVVAGAVTNAAVVDGGTTYPDSTGAVVNNFPAPGVIYDAQANAEEVAKCQDLIDAMTSIHDLYQAADNVAVGAEDRFTAMRRFT